jgi:hypothetical protein
VTGEVRLHGNRILYRSGDLFRVDMTTFRRWPTRTTVSRVNDVIRCMTDSGETFIGIKAVAPVVYIDHVPMDAQDVDFDPAAFVAPR